MGKRKTKQSKRSIQNMNQEEIQEIIEALIKNPDKRQIANQFRTEIGNVYSIYNKNKAYIMSEKEKLRIAGLKRELNMESVEAIAKEIIPQKDSSATTQQEEVEANMHMKKKRARLTEDVVLGIMQALEEGMDKNDIAILFEVSYSSVCRIANGKHTFQQTKQTANESSIEVKPINDAKEENAPEETQFNQPTTEESIVSLDNGIITIPVIEDDAETEKQYKDQRIPVTKYIKMGMVSDRHNMPITSYVFNTMSSDLMFDYDKQYEIAKKKILEQVSFDDNGNPINGLFIYVTGLTCALTTIIKVCQDYKINLVLLHYNNTTKGYQKQVVTKFRDDSNILTSEFDGLNYRNIYTFGCSIDEFVSNGGGWEISECFFSEDPKDITLDALGHIASKKSVRDLVLFTSKSKAWEYYIALANNNKSNNIYMNQIQLKDGNYHKVGTISKCIMNF